MDLPAVAIAGMNDTIRDENREARRNAAKRAGGRRR